MKYAYPPAVKPHSVHFMSMTCCAAAAACTVVYVTSVCGWDVRKCSRNMLKCGAGNVQTLQRYVLGLPWLCMCRMMVVCCTVPN